MFSFLHTTNFKHCSDEELMLYMAKGKEKAFDELYCRYAKKMQFFFYQKLYQDSEKAQDFLQDLFLKIIEKPELFSSDFKFKTWIYTLASNMCKNEYRRNAVRGTKVQDFDLTSVLEEFPFKRLMDTYDIDLFRKCLQEQLNRMDDSQRLPFVLRHQEHLSIKEISEIMECSEGTVKSRIFYTIKKLAEGLQVFNTLKEATYGSEIE